MQYRYNDVKNITLQACPADTTQSAAVPARRERRKLKPVKKDESYAATRCAAMI
jgi:hypothetical protein